MDRFVRAFSNRYHHDLAEDINNHAKKHNLNILQVSYSADRDFYKSERALVLFEKIN